jgi:hypothetical protein
MYRDFKPATKGEYMNIATFTAEAGEGTLAPVISALHDVYDDLAIHVRNMTRGAVVLPPVVFISQRDDRAWGHITTRPTWATPYEAIDEDYAYAPFAVAMGLGTETKYLGKYEIMVSAENLARGGREVFGTVAHEVAHAINIVRGVQDVDSNGRHNKKFKQTAEYFFGLLIEEYAPNHWAGWTKTTVTRECAEKWSAQIEKISESIRVASGYGRKTGTGTTGTGGGFVIGGGDTSRGRDKNGLKAVCSCGSIIRTSRRALDKGILCGGCDSEFIYVG